MQPNITVMLAFKNQKKLPVSSIKFDDDIKNLKELQQEFRQKFG